MNQTKKMSLIETFTNIFIGYWINFICNYYVFRLFGWDITITQNIQIGLLFTFISVIRLYGLRRLFNYIESKPMFNIFKKQSN